MTSRPGGNVVPSDQHYTPQGPHLDEDYPGRGLEPRLVLVLNPHPDGLVGDLAAEVDQQGGHNVLDPGAGVAPCDAHQKL